MFYLLTIPLISIIVLFNFYHHKQLEIKKQIKLNNTGIYEIHITVDPKNNYVKLLSFIDQYKSYKLKPVFAVSDVMNNQYMLSCFISEKDDSLAIDKANELSDKLKDDSITVLRTKVESHNVSKFPQDLIENKNNYFEFHVKVIKYPSYKQLEKYISFIKGLSQVHAEIGISYNLCSQNLKPLLTIRMYHYGFLYANTYKNNILDDMRKNNYEFDDKIQQEYSIYDTYPQLDEGWLKKQIY